MHHVISVKVVAASILREVIVVTGAGLAIIAVISAYTHYRSAPAAGIVRHISKQQPGIDDPLTIRNLKTHGSPVTILLAVSEACPHCKNSIAFYRSLSNWSKSNRVPIVVAVPSIRSAQSFLERANLRSSHLCQWDDLNIEIAGTPTIIVSDRNGKIRRIWQGELSERRKSDLAALMNDPSLLAKMPDILETGDANVSKTALESLKRKYASLSIVDVREREEFNAGHYPGAVNIPYVELLTRSTFELPASSIIAIDCSQLAQSGLCRMAVNELVSEALYPKVIAINGDMIDSAPCRMSVGL